MIVRRPLLLRMSPWTGAVVAMVAATLLVAGSAGLAQNEDAPADLTERGHALYLELHCGACHTLAATGSQGFFGPGHDAMGVIAGARIADPNYQGSAGTAAEYVRESITDPKAYIVPGYAFTRHSMPVYDLPVEDLDALVAFLMLQTGAGSS